MSTAQGIPAIAQWPQVVYRIIIRFLLRCVHRTVILFLLSLPCVLASGVFLRYEFVLEWGSEGIALAFPVIFVGVVVCVIALAGLVAGWFRVHFALALAWGIFSLIPASIILLLWLDAFRRWGLGTVEDPIGDVDPAIFLPSPLPFDVAVTWSLALLLCALGFAIHPGRRWFSRLVVCLLLGFASALVRYALEPHYVVSTAFDFLLSIVPSSLQVLLAVLLVGFLAKATQLALSALNERSVPKNGA